ncbi:MAG: hypothetical protein HQM04_12420 [Magnetococcales bacterium]|nr:hypothetical protein [Magnetococcales bacterium]MBF0115829.1 hypothetical protein [Magnetococcales bacterium]
MANQSCLATFGEQVDYRPSMRNHPELGEQIIQVTGVFAERDVNFTLMGGGANGVDAVGPQTTLELRPSDLGFFPKAGDEVTVHGTLYQVVDARSDGREMALLSLAQLSEW